MRFSTIPLSSMVATTLIAALIWFVAEAQTVHDVQQELSVALLGQDQGNGALIVRAGEGTDLASGIMVHLQGSTARVGRLIDELGSQVVLTVGHELPKDPGTYTIDLREAVRKLPVFRSAAVTISSCVPESMQIEIDRLESTTLTLRPEIEADLDTAPTLEPAEVTLTAPSSVMAMWLGRTDTTIPVKVGGERLSGLAPGITHRITARPIELPPELKGRWSVRLSPTQTTATVRLRSRTSSVTRRELPVRLLLPPEAQGRWIVEIPAQSATLRDVIFTGPESSVERIQSGAAVPTAVVELSLAELEQGVGSKPARIIDLPPGVTYQVASAIVSVNVRRLAGVDPNNTTPTNPAGPGSGPTSGPGSGPSSGEGENAEDGASGGRPAVPGPTGEGG